MLRWIALSFVLLGGGGAWRHDLDRETFRALGRDPAFAAVGRLEVDGTTRRGGSGVLVAPGWVLTAAHVVDTWTPGAAWRFSWGVTDARVADVILHPAYQGARSVNARVDLALVRLASPVRGIAPLPLAEGPPVPGQRVAIVGHGYAQPASTLGADQTPPGEKYAGFNIVDSIAGHHFFIDIDAPHDPTLNALGSPIPDSLEYGPLGGDSGGGIITVAAGTPLLVGIIGTVSFELEHLNRHGWYGLVNRLNRVDLHREWMDSILGR